MCRAFLARTLRRNRGTKELLRKVSQAMGKSPHRHADRRVHLGEMRGVPMVQTRVRLLQTTSEAVPSPAAQSGKIAVDGRHSVNRGTA